MGNEEVIDSILQVMKVTRRDVIDDFREAISDVNTNGLPQAVWARRAKVLVKIFKHNDRIKLLHIKRGFWEINPVFNTETGELYLLSSKDNFKNIKNKYLKNGTSTHYTYDLLIYNSGLLPLTSEVTLFQNNDDDEKRITENQKMLGEWYENVKKVYIVIVDYVVDEAIEASCLLLNDQYATVDEVNLTPLLHENDNDNKNLNGAMDNTDNKQHKPLVTLKKKQNKKE